MSIEDYYDITQLNDFEYDHQYNDGPTKMPIEETLCPECNNSMTPRSGQYGKFWGCSNFPKCKGTRDSQGRSKKDRDEWKRENNKDGVDLVNDDSPSDGMAKEYTFNKKE